MLHTQSKLKSDIDVIQLILVWQQLVMLLLATS